MDEYYLVAKSKQSGFVTTCTLDQMIQKVSAGELLGEYFATRSGGLSYHQLMRSGVPITWVPAADLIAASDKAAAVQSQAEEHVQEHAKQYLSDHPFNPRTEVSADAIHIASRIVKHLWIIFVLLPFVIGLLLAILGVIKFG